ncbi:class F sortase [Streptomyces sp. NPDC051907]|uniref:class F sortase n=1 Tax=Streptomyces sp. NPDC051907 TaxID=3155284 RepID=UPI003447AA05
MFDQPPPGSGPSHPARTSRGLGRTLLWPVVAVLLGFMLIYNSFEPSAQGKPLAGPSVSAPARVPSPASPDAERLEMPRSAPNRVSIPAIAVDAPFVPLAIGKSGALDAPPAHDVNLVGWFAGGPTPGELGTAVIAGHVDTKTGPAVFALLSSVQPGNKVDISRQDGTTATFVVDAVESFSKADFPNDRVYADTPDAQLRVITCGGDYDREAKDYTENLVVFAHLDSYK